MRQSYFCHAIATLVEDDLDSSPALCVLEIDPVVLAGVNPAPAECERVFSSTKKLVTPERNRLYVDILEAFECLKNWRDHGLIQQRDYAPENPDFEGCELQDGEDDDCDPWRSPVERMRGPSLSSTRLFLYTIY
jgi:hypothetical protein